MMLRILRHLIYSEKGQALPITLALLVLGGLMIVPTLNHAATGLNSGKAVKAHVYGTYAAEAGVEYAIWCLMNSTTPPTQLSETINGMTVAIQAEDMGTYTLYFGEVIQADSHYNYLDIDGEMVWEESAQAYKYTITVTWQPHPGAPTIHLEEVGARLPVGYSYQEESADDFSSNLSQDEPEEAVDGYDAQLLNWEFSTPLPCVTQTDPTKTQTFYVTGSGNLEGHYAWVVANRDDIGSVGEITGSLHRVTATATRSGEVTGSVVADIMSGTDSTYIISWQISR